MKNVGRCTLFALQFFLAGIAIAATGAESLQKCLDMQGQAASEDTLECYNRTSQDLLTKKHPKSFRIARDRGIAEEWVPSDEPVRVYKQNYFLIFAHSSNPNNTPTSPNPDNQVPFTYALDNKEIKFQISLKAHLAGSGRHALWFGYTQLSFWQAYDREHSSPFRENDYEPELIYSFRPENVGLAGFTASFLNAGLVHQSNGQAIPRSRNWNRFYVQVGIERDFGEYGKLALQPRWWRRLGGNAVDDDNPDIIQQLGNGEFEARYYYRQGVLSAIARIHSLQLDLALPAPRVLGVLIQNANFHLQYFNGNGESLMDYNQRHRSYGLGISMPFE
ncbi:MAG: phospholipase A [Sideroxyarcus sp.]|nr:phospholipase A [Sideroxyarcus sp.]